VQVDKKPWAYCWTGRCICLLHHSFYQDNRSYKIIIWTFIKQKFWCFKIVCWSI